MASRSLSRPPSLIPEFEFMTWEPAISTAQAPRPSNIASDVVRLQPEREGQVRGSGRSGRVIMAKRESDKTALAPRKVLDRGCSCLFRYLRWGRSNQPTHSSSEPTDTAPGRTCWFL